MSKLIIIEKKMPCKASKCCCCVPIKWGTYIIGGLHAVYLCLFLYRPDYLGAALNFFVGTTFVFMLFKDTAMMRGIFFAAFSTYICMITALNLYFTFFITGIEKNMFQL